MQFSLSVTNQNTIALIVPDYNAVQYISDIPLELILNTHL